MEIYLKLSSLPDHLKEEVIDFIDSLKSKLGQANDIVVRKSGLAKGLIKMTDDFDEPLDDFKDYME